MQPNDNPYVTAISLTHDAIRLRTRSVRGVMFGIALILLVLLPFAFYSTGWRGLIALTWTAPMAGVFFLVDSLILTRWQQQLLACWVAKRIDLVALNSALCAHAMLPRNTVDAMMASLPSALNLAVEQMQSPEIREGIFLLLKMNGQYESARRGLRMCSCLMIATGLSLLATFGSVQAFIGLVLLALFLEIVSLWGMRWYLTRRVQQQFEESHRELLQDLDRRGQLAKPLASFLLINLK